MFRSTRCLADRQHLATALTLWLVCIAFAALAATYTRAAETDLPTYDLAQLKEQHGLTALKWFDASARTGFEDLPALDSGAWQKVSIAHSVTRQGRYWVAFALINSSTSSESAIVSFDEVFAEQADLFQLDSSGTLNRQQNGLQIPIVERAIKTRVPAFKVELGPGERQILFIAYTSQFEASLGLQLQTPEQFSVSVEWQSLGYMFFFGGAIAIVLFNLFLFVSMRDGLYLVYSAHALCVIGFVARYSGFSLYLIDNPADHYKLASISWLQALLLVQFTRSLLATRSLAKILDAVLLATMAVFGLLAIATFVEIKFYSVGIRLSIPLLLMLFSVGIYSAVRGNRMGWLFIAAQTPYILGYLLLAAMSTGALEYSPLNRFGFIAGSLLELIIFSMALGYRFRLLQRERLSAQQQYAELQRSLNDELQAQVAKRTQDLERATAQLRLLTSDYATLLENIGVGIARLNASDEVVYANSAYTALLDNIPELKRELLKHLKLEAAGEAREIAVTDDTTQRTHHLILNACARHVDADGAEGLWLLVTDVTSLRMQESRLQQAAKMATLGEMSTGMAHELNQPLNAIRLSVENIRRAMTRHTLDDDKLGQRLARIDGNIDRAAKLIAQMRTFGRVSPDTFERFDLAASIQRSTDLIEEQLRLEQIRLTVAAAESGSLWVDGSPSQFEQVILNLLNNARAAIVRHNGERSISISTSSDSDFHKVVVEDTGGGIPAALMERIFEPFFTTAEVGAGAGLGASVSYGIIKDMGGDIQVDNGELGARFTVTLPVAEGNTVDATALPI